MVPVWLVSGEVSGEPSNDISLQGFDGPLTAERVTRLRDALGSFLDVPLISIEARPMPTGSSVTGGQLLDAASPLARHLADLLRAAPQSNVAVAAVAAESEVLYRMVVPAKVAAQLGQGLVRSMPSKAAANGVHSGILGAKGLVGQATFVPAVSQAVKAGSAASPAGTAAAGGVAAAGGAAAGAGLVTVAAPLVLLALATVASVHAEEQRRKAIEHVTVLLEDLHRSSLERERDQLTGCTRAIEKATAVLLDEGVIGHSLGLDSAVNTIDTAIATATRRAREWQQRLDGFPAKGVEIADLKKAFPGIEHESGDFRVHLRLAALAIALKRRVAVLQAVDHAQRSPEKAFQRFTQMLDREQQSVDELEADLSSLLDAISRVRFLSPRRFVDKLMTRGEVDDLLKWPNRLRLLAESEAATGETVARELEITMVKHQDGRVRVLPLSAAAGNG